MTAPEELVRVVARDRLFGDGQGWLGVRRDGLAAAMRCIEEEGSFVPRSRAESDAGLKQIIPYLVLRDGDRLFLMRRSRAGGDPRLHDLCTIGIGGHLNPGDGSPTGGLAREWLEEIESDFIPEFEFVGLLNDDTVEVGRHHLGLVYVADAAGRPVSVRERDKLSGAFEELTVVRHAYDQMETWSRLVLDSLAAGGWPGGAHWDGANSVSHR
jgi:predicted NUDIX family phosphoesterase